MEKCVIDNYHTFPNVDAHGVHVKKKKKGGGAWIPAFAAKRVVKRVDVSILNTTDEGKGFKKNRVIHLSVLHILYVLEFQFYQISR